MKSSRLSPAGRLQGGPCMLRSGLEDTGCASCSCARLLWGRRKEGKALLGLQHSCPLGSRPWGGGGEPGCGSGMGPAGWELKDPGNRPLWVPACRLPVQAPRGTMGCLLGWGSSSGWEWGRGRPGPGGGKGMLARSRPVAPLARPSGLPCCGAGSSPRGRHRELGQLAARSLDSRTVSVPLPPPGLCSMCLPEGTRGSSGQQQGHQPTVVASSQQRPDS